MSDDQREKVEEWLRDLVADIINADDPESEEKAFQAGLAELRSILNQGAEPVGFIGENANGYSIDISEEMLDAAQDGAKLYLAPPERERDRESMAKEVYLWRYGNAWIPNTGRNLEMERCRQLIRAILTGGDDE